jgi:hypothetical protein
LSLLDFTDGTSRGGKGYDLEDERKSKDAGLAALENTKKDGVVADPKGNNAQKYKYAKSKGNGTSYINNLYQGINQKPTPGSADVGSINYRNVKRVAYRKGGKTVVKD